VPAVCAPAGFVEELEVGSREVRLVETFREGAALDRRERRNLTAVEQQLARQHHHRSKHCRRYFRPLLPTFGFPGRG
jgi:hypothetical protein